MKMTRRNFWKPFGALAALASAPFAAAPAKAELAPVKCGELADDAAKWAAAFCERNPGVDEGMMIGWFANAIELSHDHRMSELSSNINDVVSIQCSKGNWNCDPYMHGLANGMILVESLVNRSDPAFMDAPEKWLMDNPMRAGAAAVESS